MRPVKAILFDCDGVLIDSEPMGCRALAQVVTAHGLPMTEAEAVRVFSGNSTAASKAWLAAAGLPPEPILAAADAALFSMFDAHVPLVSGVEEVLEAFDLPKAVCSNSMLHRLDRSIRRTTLAAHFAGHIYSAEQVARSKPSPDLALFAAERLGVRVQDCVFLDDNVQGIACGTAAGCLTVGFVGPSETRTDHAEALRRAGAHHVVHGMSEFRALMASGAVDLALAM